MNLVSRTLVRVSRRAIEGLPLARLIARIAANGDELALAEFHNHRTPFRWRGQFLGFVDFVQRLRDVARARQLCGPDPLALERAYDLTVAKFSNVPHLGERTVVDAHAKRQGPDCRKYFAACSRQIRSRCAQGGVACELDRERVSAQCLQGLVMRHFLLSCRDARRSTYGRVSCYRWEVDGAILHIYMPSTMNAHQRRAWLSAHVGQVDPLRPGECQRVQEIIDRLMQHGKLTSLSGRALAQCAGPQDTPQAIAAQIASRGLAQAVADEKARNIAQQRPAIRAMGPEKLSLMVRSIFEELEGGCYHDRRLAHIFGLSPSSFSRFAGSRWPRTKHNGAVVPDLWRNTAQVIGSHPAFIEAAQSAGVWRTVQTILGER